MFSRGNSALPVLNSEVDIFLKFRTAIKQTVITMYVIRDIIVGHLPPPSTDILLDYDCRFWLVVRWIPFYRSYRREKRIKLLRDYRVSETLNSVHPIGYPIRYSRYSGFIGPILPSGVSSRKLLSRPS